MQAAVRATTPDITAPVKKRRAKYRIPKWLRDHDPLPLDLGMFGPAQSEQLEAEVVRAIEPFAGTRVKFGDLKLPPLENPVHSVRRVIYLLRWLIAVLKQQRRDHRPAEEFWYTEGMLMSLMEARPQEMGILYRCNMGFMRKIDREIAEIRGPWSTHRSC